MSKEMILAFLANAKTRSRVPYEVTALEKDVHDNIIALRGTVTDILPGKESPEAIQMFWQPEGACMSGPSLLYDLVTEELL